MDRVHIPLLVDVIREYSDDEEITILCEAFNVELEIDHNGKPNLPRLAKNLIDKIEHGDNYMSERDPDGILKPMQHYFNGTQGIEPELRFEFEPIAGVTASDFSLDKILASILLGPTMSSPMAVLSMQRMLDLIGKAQLKDRVVASTIPLRAN